MNNSEIITNLKSRIGDLRISDKKIRAAMEKYDTDTFTKEEVQDLLAYLQKERRGLYDSLMNEEMSRWI